jgi:alpha-D-ribose 1-methylphosphonate 5-triphosphate synthase subunit PhnH
VGIQSPIPAGFSNAVAESQAVFRVAMNAMARPGCPLPLPLGLAPPPPLAPTAAALLLALADFETPVWLDPPLADAMGVAEFVRFHTGARLAGSVADAVFAVIADAAHLPPLASFPQGTPEYPDRSATLILQVDALRPSGWRLEGPGISGHTLFSADPVPPDFVGQIRANRSRFPCGVDIFFAACDAIAALPRSTRLTEIA